MSENESLHGNAPDNSNVALLIIDIISDFEFEDGEKLFKNALPMAEKIAALKKRAKKVGIPAIYVNDNFGKWQSDFKKLLAHASRKSVRGSKIAELLAPDEDDYFVLKPKHSGFFSTTLDVLLEYLNCETLILTGVATDICILFTANDAYMRDFKLVVPRDCVAANGKNENERTLRYIERLLKADTSASTELNFKELTKAA
ncbi:MAG TPA: isochorismatase family cysteine hydrolase [Pyrinomonadaceae bacterium]|nr:isochorismatase family cysteine hydrolase [Pyrinomonadaceae bacterium]